MENEIRNPGLKAFKEAIESTDDIGQLVKLKEDLRDWLIEMMPAIIHSQKGVRKKAVLRKRFNELTAEKYGIDPYCVKP